MSFLITRRVRCTYRRVCALAACAYGGITAFEVYLGITGRYGPWPYFVAMAALSTFIMCGVVFYRESLWRARVEGARLASHIHLNVSLKGQPIISMGCAMLQIVSRFNGGTLDVLQESARPDGLTIQVKAGDGRE